MPKPPNAAAARLVTAAAIVLSICHSTSAQSQPPTAREIVKAIQDHVGIPWMTQTVDTFKAGDPDTPVTGIAVTMMATLDVLQRAAANHQNLIITHEPTFFSHQDVPEGMDQSDLVWTAKRAFIDQHHLIVWRFHDHWHRMNPDGILAGMVHALGWEKYQHADDPKVFTIPETTVGKLAAEVAKRLDSPSLRVVGNLEMKITKVALTPGFSGFVRETHALEQDDVEVLMAGETREWETVEYVADAATEGKRKAMIIIGHIPSEQAGMEECTRWLKTFIPNVPIEFVPAKQPFSLAPR